MIEIELTRGLVTVVDDEDSDLVDFKWHAQINRHHRYATRDIYWRENGRKGHGVIRMHRVVLQRIIGRPLEPTEFVDHIDGNGLNNCRDNLRLASNTENTRNCRRQAKNKLGYKGVWQIHKGYAAKIVVNNKSIYLGFFKTPQEAHAAYCEAAKKYHGEFARFE